MITVYALADPFTDEIRYIGVTKKTLGDRLSSHLWAAKKGKANYVCNWIRSLAARPKIIQIESGCRRNRERFWIRYYRKLGARLTNLTDGGEGVSGWKMPEEQRAKIGKLHRGKTISLEMRQRISLALKGRSKPPFSRAHKRRIGLAQLGMKRGPHSEEHKQKIAAAMRGNKNGRYGRRGKPVLHPKEHGGDR